MRLLCGPAPIGILESAGATAIAARCGLGLAAASLIALAGLRLRALTSSGALAAVVVGALSFGFGGAPLAAALIVFFTVGSLLSGTAGARSAWQVLANGGVATAVGIAAGLSGLAAFSWTSALLAAAIGAVAAACGDTCSTEVGLRSRQTTRSIMSLKPVPPGQSGGVTPVGVLAAPAGGLAIGLASAGVAAWWPLAATPLAFRLAWLWICPLTALCSSLIDSVLGATVQARWRCSACGQLTECRADDCGAVLQLARGVAWMDNSAVNLVASLAGAGLALLFARVALT